MDEFLAIGVGRGSREPVRALLLSGSRRRVRGMCVGQRWNGVPKACGCGGAINKVATLRRWLAVRPPAARRRRFRLSPLRSIPAASSATRLRASRRCQRRMNTSSSMEVRAMALWSSSSVGTTQISPGCRSRTGVRRTQSTRGSAGPAESSCPGSTPTTSTSPRMSMWPLACCVQIRASMRSSAKWTSSTRRARQPGAIDVDGSAGFAICTSASTSRPRRSSFVIQS